MTSVVGVLTALFLSAVAPGPVTNVSITSSSQRAEIVVEVAGEVEVRDFTMEGPSRLVLDLMNAKHALRGESFRDIDRGGIRSVSASQYSEDVVRLVIELDELVGYQVTQADGYVRVSLDNPNGAFDPWSSALVDGMELTPIERPVSTVESTRELPFQQASDLITLSFRATPIGDVLFTFSEFSGRSIIPGANITGFVSADIRSQPWDEALDAILESQGLAARELDNGIIRVDNLENLSQREAIEPLQTRMFQINYTTALELSQSIGNLLSDRGSSTVGQSTNTLVVMDVPRVLEQVGALVAQLDRRTPQVTIQAKIIFVNRTDLNEFGVTYDLKDSQGNQLNFLTPGGIDSNGDGIIDPNEFVSTGTDVIQLGGASLAALGNANARVVGPSLSLLTSLIIGRHTLIGFIETLESLNLSEVEAVPSLMVADNNQARILVGEETPIRVIDAGTGGGGAGTLPTAEVEIRETGIILQVTPHVTDGDNVLLELAVERSAAVLAESDAGITFTTQEATTRVLVPDGRTVVAAALTVTETSESRTGIPLLMDIPLLGRLFRVNRESTIQRDLMILVTPYIQRD